MDFNLLTQVINDNFKEIEPNVYEPSKLGTLGLAAKYTKSKADCNAVLIGKHKLNLFYKNKGFGFIYNQRPSTNDIKAVKICGDKFESEKYFKESGIKSPVSKAFDISEYNLAKNYVETNNGKQVLKPANLNAGKGVVMNVDSSNFDFSWNQVIMAYGNSAKEKRIIIQNQLDGIETRFLIIEGKFNSAMLRVPANVIGNGNDTLETLIIHKNEEREHNPHLKKLPIKVNEIILSNLKRMGMDLNYVPKNNELVFLHVSSNISLGGDSYEISHLVNREMTKLAESAVRSIPGMRTAGVDIMFNSLEDKKPSVLEINAGANLRMHHYPWKGNVKKPIYDLIDTMLNEHIETIN